MQQPDKTKDEGMSLVIRIMIAVTAIVAMCVVIAE